MISLEIMDASFMMDRNGIINTDLRHLEMEHGKECQTMINSLKENNPKECILEKMM